MGRGVSPFTGKTFMTNPMWEGGKSADYGTYRNSRGGKIVATILPECLSGLDGFMFLCC